MPLIHRNRRDISRASGKPPARAGRSFVLGGTLVFALAQLIYFTPKLLPNGMQSNRDAARFLIFLGIVVSCGFIASIFAWRSLQRWFER